jgi:zinc-finger binding domain of transposase IS66
MTDPNSSKSAISSPVISERNRFASADSTDSGICRDVCTASPSNRPKALSGTSAARARGGARTNLLSILRLTQTVEAGEDITETLEVVPHSWKVIQTVREKFSCRACETISQPPAPFHVTPRGLVGPNLLATILFEKFGQHQPLNRQSERYSP